MSITTKAMVLNLSIGIWAGHRFDREATRKATEEAGAEADAARVNKHLVPKEALKPINSAANAVRSHFYERTLPWKDNGDRLLTRTAYMDFIVEHERLVGEFKSAAEHFIANDYPVAVEKAAFRMGDLFNINDYPTQAELHHKFYVYTDIDAVTEAGDFRVQMDKEQTAEIQSTMERAMQERIGNAMQDVWDRLMKVVSAFHARMADEDAIFRQSTLDNISGLLEILPGLNLLDDPRLEAMGRELHVLTGYDAKTLREDKAARFQAAGEAKQIMDKMDGFMNAFAGMAQAA